MIDRPRRTSTSRVSTLFLLALCLMGSAMILNSAAAQRAGGASPEEPRQQATPAMRAQVYEALVEAQSCLETEDYQCARELIDETVNMDLSSYELAQLWNFRAFIDYSEGDVARATASYENVLRLPDAPLAMRQSTLYSLHQLYVHGEQYQTALEALDEWFELTPDPNPQAYIARAMIEFTLERFDAALASLESAIARVSEPQEDWYELLLAIHHEMENQQGFADTLEILNSNWPTPERARQLEYFEEL